MLDIFQNQEFVISFLLGILGILFTAYFSIVERKYRQLAYTCNTNKITFINPNNNFIGKISYNDKPLNELSYTDLIIWCKGKKVINLSDVAPKSPLTINISDNMNILDYQIIAQNEPTNNIELLKDNNNIKINGVSPKVGWCYNPQLGHPVFMRFVNG